MIRQYNWVKSYITLFLISLQEVKKKKRQIILVVLIVIHEMSL